MFKLQLVYGQETVACSNGGLNTKGLFNLCLCKATVEYDK